MLGKDAEVSKLTTTASLVSDRIIEAMGFLLLAAALIIFTNVPKWMHYGLTISLVVTVVLYTIALIYSTRELENRFFKRFQEGIAPLFDWRISLGRFRHIASFVVHPASDDIHDTAGVRRNAAILELAARAYSGESCDCGFPRRPRS